MVGYGKKRAFRRQPAGFDVRSDLIMIDKTFEQ